MEEERERKRGRRRGGGGGRRSRANGHARMERTEEKRRRGRDPEPNPFTSVRYICLKNAQPTDPLIEEPHQHHQFRVGSPELLLLSSSSSDSVFLSTSSSLLILLPPPPPLPFLSSSSSPPPLHFLPMPSLSSLPSPISSFFNNNRWAELPQSENAQTELLNSRARQLITANLTLPRYFKSHEIYEIFKIFSPRTSSIPFPRVLDKSDYAHLGDLLRQEHLAGSSQMLCHYRNISSSAGRDRPAPSPISLICELGCCANSPGGCCTVDDPSGHSGTNTYFWPPNSPIGLLAPSARPPTTGPSFC